MTDPSHESLKRLTPAALCLVAGIIIGLVTGSLGLWVCIGVAVGAVLTGLLASRSSR